MWVRARARARDYIGRCSVAYCGGWCPQGAFAATAPRLFRPPIHPSLRPSFLPFCSPFLNACLLFGSFVWCVARVVGVGGCIDLGKVRHAPVLV